MGFSHLGVGQLLVPHYGGQTYSQKVQSIFGLSLIAYWPLWEASGVVANDISGNGRNGSYTGVTLGQTGIGDGRTCPLFDGANDFTDIYGASFVAAFNGVAGTMAAWAKMSAAAVWTDTRRHRVVTLAVNTTNTVFIEKHTTNNRLNLVYVAGNTAKTVTVDGLSYTAWMHLAITWDKNAGASGQVMAYINGVQVGVTLDTLGVWAGALASDTCAIGVSDTTPVTWPWDGYIAHVAIGNTAKTPAEIAKLAVV